MTKSESATLSEKWLLGTLSAWDPEQRRVSCANCLHAKVHPPAGNPVVECEVYPLFVPIPLTRLIRGSHPRGFRNAERCESFESMSE